MSTINGQLQLSNTQAPRGRAKLEFQPLSGPQIIDGKLMLTSPITIHADTDGAFTVDLEPDLYRVSAGDVPDVVLILVPEGAGPHEFTDLITSDLLAGNQPIGTLQVNSLYLNFNGQFYQLSLVEGDGGPQLQIQEP